MSEFIACLLQFVVRVVAYMLVQVPGYLIGRKIAPNETAANPEGYGILLVGILFWLVIGLIVWFVVSAVT